MQTENLFKISTNKQYIHKHFGKVEVKCVRFGTVEFIDENNKYQVQGLIHFEHGVSLTEKPISVNTLFGSQPLIRVEK